MKRKIIYIAALCLSLNLLTGCNDFLEQGPLSAPSSGEFYTNEAEMKGGLTGVYKSVYWNTGNTAYQSMFDNWTDIALLRAPDLGEGNIDVFNAHAKSIWSSAYVTIQRANNLIVGMEQGKANVTPAVYSKMEAEAKGIRALAYFYLINMFGDVPLITKPLDESEFNTQVRTPKADIINFIYSELDAAASVLAWAPSDRGRMSKAVVLGLKARTALYNKDYKLAAETAKQVIDGANLSLTPNFQDLFTKAGQGLTLTSPAAKEIMFEVLYSDADANSISYLPLGSISRAAGGQSGRFPQQRLVDMFEAKDGKRIDESPLYDPKNPAKNRDNRLKYTVAIPGDTLSMNLTTFVFDIYKNTTSFQAANGTWSTKTNADYDNAYGPSKSGVGLLHAKYTLTAENAFTSRVNFILMRYAEILLTYAEAKIELNEIDASALNAINLVRKRAGQPEAIQGSQDKMRQLIRRERTVELAMEGFRWFDIRRWDIASIVMPQKIMGIAKDPAVVPANPSFTKSSIHDLNNIPTYDASESVRMVREQRFWYPKLNLLPIPQSERDINPKLTQNPEW